MLEEQLFVTGAENIFVNTVSIDCGQNIFIFAGSLAGYIMGENVKEDWIFIYLQS